MPARAPSVACFLVSLVSLVFVSAAAAEDSRPPAERIFDRARVVDIRIELPAEDWSALCAQSRTFVDALASETAPRPFTYFEGDIVVDGLRIPSVGIRKKGFIGSLDRERPSLKIKFDEFVEQSPIAGVDRLTLNNNKQDGSLASQFVTYDLFTRAGIAAPRCNLAHVTVNGTSLGIYSNVESVRRPFLKRVFGDDSGVLYEGTIVDFISGRLDRFELKTGTDPERATLTRLASILEAEGELDHAALAAVVDLEAFFTYWVIESLSGYWDGYNNNQNNYFVYENPANSKLYWIPWGADGVFEVPPPLPFLEREPKSVSPHSALARRLYGDEAMRERYRKKLLAVLDSHWNEKKLGERLDRVAPLVKDSLHASQTSFRDKIEAKRRFIDERRAEVMAELEHWPPAVFGPQRVPMYARKVGSARGTFTTTWRANRSDPPAGESRAEPVLELDGKTVLLEDLEVRAESIRHRGGPDHGKRAAAISLKGKTPRGKELTLTLALEPSDFRPTNGQGIPVQGSLVRGTGFLAIGGFHFVAGTLTLDAAEEVGGAKVAGSFELTVARLARPGHGAE